MGFPYRVGLAVMPILVLCSAGPAWAEPGEPLLVFHGPAEPAPPVSEALQALRALATERGTAVVDVSPAPPPVISLDRYLARGIEAYEALRPEEAFAELDQGIVAAARRGGLGLGRTGLSDLHIYRGLVLTQLGDSVRAWDDFVRAAVIDPTRRLDPVRFPPRAVETFTRAVDAVAPDHGSLLVRVPGDCALTIDGRDGAAGEAMPMARGDHYVAIECPQAAPYGRVVTVVSDPTEIEPAIERRRPPTDAELVAAARERRAPAVIGVLVEGRGRERVITLRLLDASSGKPRMQLLVSAPPDAPVNDRVTAAVERLVREWSGPVAMVPDTRTPAPTRWYRRPWVWGVAGAAVTAAILAPLALRDRDGGTFDLVWEGDPSR